MSPNADVPAELANHTTVINWPLPDREEIADIIDKLIEDYDLTDVVKNGQRDAAIDAAVGLTGEEAQACYSRSLVQLKTIDAATVAKEKKRVITREKILEWYDPIPGGLDAVGGLENLKTWLVGRAAAYTAKAREYGLPRPKGTMLVGISGCGKSLTAKSIATAWNCPLIRVDLGALKNELVGRSEANLRKAFAIIEALGFCVVWFDEVEKALQGATSGSADGGVSADAMGAVLTWMQERKSDAFVIMGDKAKRKRVVQSDGLTSAMALKTFNGWNRWGFEPRIEEISMPWCDRCQCWHHDHRFRRQHQVDVLFHRGNVLGLSGSEAPHALSSSSLSSGKIWKISSSLIVSITPCS